MNASLSICFIALRVIKIDAIAWSQIMLNVINSGVRINIGEIKDSKAVTPQLICDAGLVRGQPKRGLQHRELRSLDEGNPGKKFVTGFTSFLNRIAQRIDNYFLQIISLLSAVGGHFKIKGHCQQQTKYIKALKSKKNWIRRCNSYVCY
jgi:hypothetical protein